METVHVKNTGRCKELFLPNSRVILSEADNPARKTRYDLIAVEKTWLGLVNIDSQAPNKVMAEWLAGQDYELIQPEYTYGKSRIDFYMERGKQKYLLEVKGCTLLCSDFCQAPIFRNFVRGHLERTIAQFPAMSSLLYADWIPQWNGFAVSATI